MKNNFEPEEFEKEKFSDLINKLNKIPKEKVSEEFDRKFYSRLDKIKIEVPVRKRINEIIAGISLLPGFKYYLAIVFTTVLFVMVVFIGILREPRTIKPVIALKDSVKTTDSVKSNTPVIKKHSREIAAEEQKPDLDKKKNTIERLLKEIRQKPNNVLTGNKLKQDTLFKILDTKLFKNKMNDFDIKGLRRDTVKAIIDILR